MTIILVLFNIFIKNTKQHNCFNTDNKNKHFMSFAKFSYAITLINSILFIYINIFKGIVHPKMKIVIDYPHVIPNL